MNKTIAVDPNNKSANFKTHLKSEKIKTHTSFFKDKGEKNVAYSL
jgi:hypothetical protein